MDNDASSNSVFLQSSGKFFNKNGHEGEVSTIWNFPIRGHLWKIHRVCYCARTGDFVTVDERGQIYWYSLKLNVYTLIKKAAAPVAAIDFSPSGTRQLIVAYENGAVLLLDIDTKSMIANVPHLSDSSLGSRAPTALCSHMKTYVTAISYARALTLWNLKTMSCISTLELDNSLLGCEFVDVSRSCQYVFVVLSTCDAGGSSAVTASSKRRPNIPVVVIYDCKSFGVCAECHFPAYERAPPSYTAYCVVEYTPSEGAMYNKPAISAGSAAKSTSESNRYVVLSGSNGSLFVWEVCLSNGSSTDSKNKCVYLGAIDLPVKMQYAVAIQQLGDRDCSPRLGVLSAEGHFIIVDIEGICSGSVGYWTVVSDVAADTVVGELLPSKTAGVPTNKTAKPVNRHLPCENYVGCKDKCVAYKEFLNIVGVDGALRVFNSQLLIGNSTVSNPNSTKNLVGRPLPVREKRRGAAVDGDSEEEEAENTVTIKEFKVVGGVLKDLAEEKRLDQLRRRKAKAAKAAALARANQFAPPSVTVTDGSSETGSDSPPKRVSLVNRAAHQRAVAAAAQEEELTLPLFELANIMPRDRVVNEEKLRTFLKKNGSYPERYRPLIWRFLLKLPENQSIFTDLAKRGPHRTYEDLYAKFPLQNGRLFTRLQATCSMVTHWSEIFGEVPYLPVIAFPFLLVFTRDDLAVLETLITIMMWWGYSWQVTFPNPPVHIVNAIDALVKLHDPKLHYHMSNLTPDNINHNTHVEEKAPIAGKMGIEGKSAVRRHNFKETARTVETKNKTQGISPGLLGWLMMSTLFTEILGKDSWLAMMDHLFTNVDKVVLMLLAPVAIMRVTRVAILQTDNYKSANMFYRRQQNVDIGQVISCMNAMLKTTPAKFLVAIHTPSNHAASATPKHKKLSVAEEEGFVGVDSIQETIADVAVSEGSPVFPLPKSSTNYPAYDGFPKQLVDYQLQNRERTMELHNETVERKKILRQLEMKISAVETEHQRWMAKHKSISQTEIEHRKNMMAKEKAHLVELRSIEEEISKSRINALHVMEEVAREELELMDRIADDTRRLMVQGEAHLNEKMELTVNVQQHRELAVKAEQTSQAHMRQLMMHRHREDWVHGLDQVFKNKEEEIEAKNAILAEEWRIQDELTAQRAAERDEHMRREAQQQKYGDLQVEMNDRLQKLYLARQAKIMEVERSRAMRLAKEHADEAIAVADRSALLLQKQELAATAEQDAIFSEKSIQQAQDRLLTSIDMIRDEGDKLVEAERVFAVKQQQARQRAKVAQLRKEWAEKQGKQLQKTLEAERYAQEQIIRMKKAAARVGVEVQQPIPIGLQGGSRSKTGVASGAGGNVNDGVDPDIQEYYQGAEERLQEVTEKLLAEQRRKYQEVGVSQSPYRETGAEGEDSDGDSNQGGGTRSAGGNARGGKGNGNGGSSGLRGSKQGQGQGQGQEQGSRSRATTQAQHGSPLQAEPQLSRRQSQTKSTSRARHPASDSSSDDQVEEAVRTSAGRSKDVIFNSEDDSEDSDGASDDSARAREAIAMKRVKKAARGSSSTTTTNTINTSSATSSSTSSVTAGKRLNVESKQLSDIADHAASYLEQFDSTMGGAGSGLGRQQRPASAKGGFSATSSAAVSGGTGGGGSGKPRPGKGYTSQYDDRALEAVTDETLRTLHELEGELQREDAEDMGRSGGGRRDRGSSHGSSGAASGSAPSGLDDDSTLWNIQAESSEEN